MLTDTVAVVLLAAGAARRMRGADKLLQRIGEVPLLRRQAMAALDVTPEVYVTLPVPGPDRAAVLDGLPVNQVPVPDAAEGMAASIRAGLAALPADVAAVLILPADMPEIGTPELRCIADGWRGGDRNQPVRGAGPDAKAGHPVLFPAVAFPALRAISGDAGARTVLKQYPPRLIRLPGRAALTDLDTPEDWAAWLAARNDRS